MARKAVKEIESRIEKIKANTAAEVSDLGEKLESLKQQRQNACEKMEKATVSGDVKTYREAKAAYQEAVDIDEMYNKRLNNLESKPLITKGEYERGIAQIMAELGEISADAKKQIVEHMEKIRIIVTECKTEIEKGNEVLHKWQHEVYRDKAEKELANGKMMHMEELEKKYRDYSVAQFGNQILDSVLYKNFIGQSK